MSFTPNQENCQSPMNPFGSFRHNGVFPKALFDQSSSGFESFDLTSPISDKISHNSNSSIFDDSSHIYINMLDRSDYSMVKPTKCCFSSTARGNNGDDQVYSDLSGFTTDTDSQYDDCSLVYDFRRSRTPTDVTEECMEEKCDGTTNTNLLSQKCQDKRHIISDPLYNNYSAEFCDLPFKGNPSHNVLNDYLSKQLSSSYSSTNESKQLMRDISIRMDKWITKLKPHSSVDNQPSFDSKNSFPTDESNSQGRESSLCFRKTLSVQSHMNNTQIPPIKKVRMPSGNIHRTPDDKESPQFCNIRCNKLPSDSIMDDISSNQMLQCNQDSNDQSLDSDVTDFLQGHLIPQGITIRNSCTNKHRVFLLKLKKLRGYFQFLRHSKTTKYL